MLVLFLQRSAMWCPCPLPLLWSFNKTCLPLLGNSSNSVSKIWFKICAWQLSWNLSLDLWGTDFHQRCAELMFLLNCFLTDWFSVNWEPLSSCALSLLWASFSVMNTSVHWQSLSCDAPSRFLTLRPDLHPFRFPGGWIVWRRGVRQTARGFCRLVVPPFFSTTKRLFLQIYSKV